MSSEKKKPKQSRVDSEAMRYQHDTEDNESPMYSTSHLVDT